MMVILTVLALVIFGLALTIATHLADPIPGHSQQQHGPTPHHHGVETGSSHDAKGGKRRWRMLVLRSIARVAPAHES